MKTIICSAFIAILAGFFVIVIFFIASSLLITEKPGFVASGVFSVLSLGIVAYFLPGTRWYLPAIIQLPLLILLAVLYQGDGLKFYLGSTFMCIVAGYTGAFTGAWLNAKKKEGLSFRLKVGTATGSLLLVIFLSAYLVRRNAMLDKPLIAVLDTIFKTDLNLQQNRILDENSPEWGIWKEKFEQVNELNMSKLDNIIREYGWPGEELIGWPGSSAIWVTIQHSSLENQEKYIPLMREAVRHGKARPSQLALLEDRILTRKGLEQIYKTQAGTDSQGNYNILPIKDESKVNWRRFSVGLGPLQLYAKKLGLKYEHPVH
jgi:hypothetical protein